AEAPRLRERRRRRGDLAFELVHVERRNDAAGEPILREGEGGAPGGEGPLRDLLFLAQLEQREIGGRDVAHEGEERRLIRRLLRAEVGARRLDAAADTAPEVELPLYVGADEERVVRLRERTERDLIRARRDGAAELGEERAPRHAE